MAPVNAAERRRQCRERLNADPERKEKHLQKERKSGEAFHIHEIDEREVQIMERATEKNRFKRKAAVPGLGLQGYVMVPLHFTAW